MAGGRPRGTQTSKRSSMSSHEEEPVDDQTTETEQEQNTTEHETTETDYEDGEPSQPNTNKKKELHPNKLWFRTSNEVVRDVTRSIKAMYKSANMPIMNWGETPNTVRDSWFTHFQNTYTWKPEHDDVVYEEFAETCRRRLPQIMYDIFHRPPKKLKDEESFLPGSLLTSLKDKRNTESFKKKSKTQTSNRRAHAEDGKLEPTHHGGSCSTLTRVKRMVNKIAKETGKKKVSLPPPDELFLETHGKVVDKASGARKLLTKKDKAVYEKYQEARKDAEEANDPIGHAELWKEVAGVNKGHVFGLGSAEDVYFYPRHSKAGKDSKGFEGGLYSQLEIRDREVEELQARLEEEKKERLKDKEESILAKKEQERINKLRDEEIQELRRLFTMTQNCSNMFGGGRKDPRDPGDGDGSSSGGYQVVN